MPQEKNHEQNTNIKSRMVAFVKQLQNTICNALEKADGKERFQEDQWKREEGGGGFSRILEKGDVFEKAGVNISEVYGKLPEAMRKTFGVEDANFFATGISLVVHPYNPHCPTSHANWRYFEMYDKNDETIDAWFGGGLDLTPHYIYEEDVKHWHSVCKKACAINEENLYQEYKEECDKYFFNSHRGEARGIGGLFFDYLRHGDKGFSHEQWFQFVQDTGNSFHEAYLPIIEKHKNQPFSEQEKYWQEIRRGRYVEFNLIHDRGTLFGLKTNGRIESIFMSLPPTVRWDYDFQPLGKEEEKLLEVLRNPKEWVKS